MGKVVVTEFFALDGVIGFVLGKERYAFERRVLGGSE